MNNRKAPSVSADVLAAAEEEAERICQQLHNEPQLSELLTKQEIEDGAPFYFTLREFIHQLKEARAVAKLTLAEVSALSGLAVESLSRLDTGASTNPTWRTLGMYAKAVGRRPSLFAVPLIPTAKTPTTQFGKAPATNAIAPVVNRIQVRKHSGTLSNRKYDLIDSRNAFA